MRSPKERESFDLARVRFRRDGDIRGVNLGPDRRSEIVVIEKKAAKSMKEKENEGKTFKKSSNEAYDVVINENKSILDKILSVALKSIFYPCAYLGMLPKLLINGSFINPILKKKRGIMIESNISSDKEKILRKIDFREKLFDDRENHQNIGQVFRLSVKKFADRSYMGVRKVISEREYYDENLKKKLKKQKKGDYEWLSYKKVGEMVDGLIAELFQFGLKKNDMVAIFAETAHYWMISFFAACILGCTVVTVYSLLTDGAIVYSLNHTEASVVFIDQKAFPRLCQNLSQLPHIRIIVTLDFTHTEATISSNEDMDPIPLVSFESMCKSARRIEPDQISEPEVNDLAVIMFTSGSTGTPKGVRLLHRNLITLICGITYDKSIWSDPHTYAAYLPLGHIMELEAELIVTLQGYKMGYSSPLSLTDMSPMIENGSKGDLSALQPTLIIFVPLLLDRIRSGITEQVRKRPKISQTLFEFALNYKRHFLKYGYTSWLFDKFIFSKTKTIVGNQLKVALVGGASLSVSTQEFITACLCNHLYQGYGLTETTGGGTLCEFDVSSYGHVGPPMSCCEIKLISWEEGGYSPQDLPYARGEILIHGANVADGYYKDDIQTQEAFVKDEKTGEVWFHTGDIGEIRETGIVSIIDRKKDIIKLRHGEYIPLAKLEGIFSQSKFNSRCCVIPNHDNEYLVLLMSVDIPSIKLLATNLEIAEAKIADLIHDPNIIQEVTKDIKSIASYVKLNKHEIPNRVVLTDDVWSPDVDLLTPSFKLKRKAIALRYADLLH